MPLTAGTRLGPYEVIAQIGEGGMGEVYRARDTRLKRDVAIKVLPASVAENTARLRRFEQEALATAALNHPNILVVFDIGEQNGTTYVVQELLDGRTMRDVMEAAALPVRQTVEYAMQIAHGLSAAHAKGIVHRDLKPENLFVSADGHVKILDFGLAKIAEADSSGAASTTMGGGTEPGMVLGTIGYMAPEQVRGLAVDHRADIFSFGAVVYEMLTGRRAFAGDTPADIMTAILKEAPPDFADSGRAVPASLVRIVERCLDKQPAGRFQSTSDLAFALRTLGSDARSGSGIDAVPAASTSSRSNVRNWLFAVAGLVIGVGLAAGAWWLQQTPSRPAPLAVFEVPAPTGLTFRRSSALSPDGSRLAFTAGPEGGLGQLWIRMVQTGETLPLAETELGGNPFWSPDSGSIGFFDQDRLRVVNLSNGRVRTICAARGPRKSATWNGTGVIVFSTGPGVPLNKVDDSGKTSAMAMPAWKGSRPFFLPDGRHFVFSGGQEFGTSGLFLSDIESGQVTELRREGVEPKYAAGHLLFILDNELVAQPFDLGSLKLSGMITSLTDDVGNSQQMNFSATDGGLVAFHRRAVDTRELVWYTRNGTRTERDATASWRNPALSPDDAKIAVERLDGSDPSDIWLLPADGSRGSMLASGRPGGAIMPVWRERLLWFLRRQDGVIEKSAEGGPERPVRAYDNARNDLSLVSGSITGSTLDGRILGFGLGSNPPETDLFVWPAGSGERRPFAQTSANETQPALSPSEKWLAYVSTPQGGRESSIWIASFPGGQTKVQVSGNLPGVQPRWSKDGKELYYVGRDHYLTAVKVDDSGETLRPGPPVHLFPTSLESTPTLGTRAQYDATRDGSRFIVAERRETSAGVEVLNVIVNWMSAIRK